MDLYFGLRVSDCRDWVRVQVFKPNSWPHITNYHINLIQMVKFYLESSERKNGVLGSFVTYNIVIVIFLFFIFVIIVSTRLE